MTARATAIQSLDQMLRGIEELILRATGAEPDGPIYAPSDEGADVRALAERSIAAHKVSVARTRAKRGTNAQKPRVSQQEADSAATLALLRHLATVRTDVSPRLGLIFGSARQPSKQDVKALREELIRKGYLKK